MLPQYITPAVTALDEQCNIDKAGNLHLYDFLLSRDISGIVLMGSTGEFFGLSLRQAQELIDAAVPYLKDKTRVFVGTGRMHLQECIELSNYAAHAGAEGVMIVSPYYFPFSEESLFAYYAAVAEKVTCPIYIYNYPDRTGYSIAPHTVLRLVMEYPHIKGLKDTIPDVHHTSEIIKIVKNKFTDFEVYSGFDNNFIHNIISGGNGCIGALSNIVPEYCMGIIKSFEEKDMDALSVYQKDIDNMMSIYSISSPFIPSLKHALTLRGVRIQEYCTMPMPVLSMNQKMDIRNLMTRHCPYQPI